MTFGQIIINIADVIVESICISGLAIIILNLINKTDNLFKDKKKFLIFICITGLMSITNRAISLLLPNLTWLKSIIFIAFISFNCFITYKVKYYKGLIVCVLISAFAAIMEVLSVLILKGFDIKVEMIVENMYYNDIYAMCLSIIELLIGICIFSFSKALASVDNKLKYFLPQLIAIIICLFPTMMLFLLNYFKYSALLIFINLLQLLVISFVGIYNLRFVAKHENTEVELENTITYNETLKKVNEGVRGFKHDMGNIVQSILGYIALNDSEGAKKYCQNLVIGFNDINVLSILSPTVIDEPSIYGVVVNKILIAREKNMMLSLDINLSVSEINFPKFELSRILGILIDNAIESGEKTDDKKLIVNMYHDFNKNCDKIIISNSIDNLNIDTEKIFEKNYSTKENPSGFGLYEVKKFIKQNKNSYIDTYIEKEQKLFTQSITIYSR